MQLHVHGEKFNQPIFFCNNISGQVEPVSMIVRIALQSNGPLPFNCNSWSSYDLFQVVPENQPGALYSTHSFKILFKEGGCGTYIPLFFNLIASVRHYNRQYQQANSRPEPRVDPLRAAETPVDEMIRHAYANKLFFSTNLAI